MLIADGDYTEAIKDLNTYLYHYSQDVDAWRELGSLYCKHWSFEKARFCYEEALLNQTDNSYNLMKLGEMLCCLGEYKSARKYLSEACCLNKSFMKALWVLWYACKKSADDINTVSVSKLCRDMLLKAYESNAIYPTIKQIL